MIGYYLRMKSFCCIDSHSLMAKNILEGIKTKQGLSTDQIPNAPIPPDLLHELQAFYAIK